jgi:5-methylcytosine-specific restriction endonuclease McrA
MPVLGATHRRILAYLVERVGQDVPGRELAQVAGIHEWARRLRELRVEHGYRITRVRAGQNSVYRLEEAEPDNEAAERWRLMNRIRRDPEHGARERILAFLRAHVGRVVTMDELRYVANVHEVGRRVRELRVEQGYIITSHMDRSDLRPGDYVLEVLEPLPVNERLSAEQRTRILERDSYRCQRCGWGVGDPATHAKRFVEVHHRVPVNEGGGSEDANLETLCNVCHDAIPV